MTFFLDFWKFSCQNRCPNWFERSGPEDKADLEVRFRELVTDARLAGLDPEDIRGIIENLLNESKEGSTFNPHNK